jgi:hypothetical protein
MTLGPSTRPSASSASRRGQRPSNTCTAAHQHEIDAVRLGVRGRVVDQRVEAGDREKARVHL